jgi:hypothetical protein
MLQKLLLAIFIVSYGLWLVIHPRPYAIPTLEGLLDAQGHCLRADKVMKDCPERSIEPAC